MEMIKKWLQYVRLVLYLVMLVWVVSVLVKEVIKEDPKDSVNVATADE